jgi:hypothetical protein
MENGKQSPQVSSIGITERGDSVMRLRMVNGSILSVSINVRDFAKLAAAGIPVVNAGR